MKVPRVGPGVSRSRLWLPFVKGSFIGAAVAMVLAVSGGSTWTVFLVQIAVSLIAALALAWWADRRG